MKNIKKRKAIELSDMISFWTKNNNGSFNIKLYTRICCIKSQIR
jgi:hypothetical protein